MGVCRGGGEPPIFTIWFFYTFIWGTLTSAVITPWLAYPATGAVIWYMLRGE